MGTRGPVGKPESRSRNHNREQKALTGQLELPSALGPEPPEWLDGIALDWYESIRISGQAVYYTPGDWLTAIVIARHIMATIRKPSAVMLASVLHGCTVLGVTEGDRRRLGIELQRGQQADPDREHAVSRMDDYRNRLNTAP